MRCIYRVKSVALSPQFNWSHTARNGVWSRVRVSSVVRLLHWLTFRRARITEFFNACHFHLTQSRVGGIPRALIG